MSTSDVAFSSDNVSPSGMSKNGSILLHAGIRAGFYDTNDTPAVSGTTDDDLETKYTNRFDDYDYYANNTIDGGPISWELPAIKLQSFGLH